MARSQAEAVIESALTESYPAWTDEHGTNIEQLAAIAARALHATGMIAEDDQSLAVAR